MKKLFSIAILSGLALAADEKGQDQTARRLDEAAGAFNEITSAPDKGIPEDLLRKARCIVIVPGVKKAAFVVGGQYGKGFISCRSSDGGNWSAPGAIRVEGGSVGFQIGGSETDVIMLVMNEHGASRVVSSQFTLGGEGEVAAGPVGRTASAETDGKMTAEILSWSRARGVFAGVALKGATLRQDVDDNRNLYGKKLENREIVLGTVVTAPPAARGLMSALDRYAH